MAERPREVSGERLAFVDALKTVASQLIVLHHLAFYGPMSDHAYPLLPAFLSWLSRDARIAVQAFLVMGGFLAARSLAPDGQLRRGSPFRLLWRRYLKLAIPYLVAVFLAILCAAVARWLMTHDSLPAAPDLPRIVAHVLLLQSILGYEGLSAGVWYVAIDFQLFAILLFLLWLAHVLARQWPLSPPNFAQRAGPSLVVALALASLYSFNRNPDWDVWGVYFFGAYGLGVLTYWASRPEQRHIGFLLSMLSVSVFGALLIDFRARIALALLVALALGLAHRQGFLGSWPRSRVIAVLGKVSYALFLVHFPVCMLVNGFFARFVPPEPALNLAGMAFAWVSSNFAALLFHRFVEGRTSEQRQTSKQTVSGWQKNSPTTVRHPGQSS